MNVTITTPMNTIATPIATGERWMISAVTEAGRKQHRDCDRVRDAHCDGRAVDEDERDRDRERRDGHEQEHGPTADPVLAVRAVRDAAGGGSRERALAQGVASSSGLSSDTTSGGSTPAIRLRASSAVVAFNTAL